VTALARRAEKEPWRGTIIDLMDAASMTEANGWLPWRAFWKAVYALPMTPDELAFYQLHTKRDLPPTAQIAEAWMVVGRGGGKTKNSALHAVYRAITFATTDPGEDVIIPILASDRRQSRSALRYMRVFNALSIVSPYVHRGTLREVIEYRTGVNVEVQTASKKAPRGFSCPTCCCDEIAWWETEDDHVNPDSEILTAVRGSLGRVKGSILLALSNPAAPLGELYQAHSDYYGVDDPDVLVWNASTLAMNATYDPRAIARAFKKDAVVAVAEFGLDGFVQFRQHSQALFDEAPLSNAVIAGRRELPPQEGVKYVAFIDAAEGSRSGDSMTLGIAHGERGCAVLDVIRCADPPFSPGEVIAHTFAPVLQRYGIRTIVGDRHAIGFVSAALRTCGAAFLPTKLSKSDIYGELLPLVNTDMVEILDLAVLRTQLLALQRRPHRGGKDSIDHPAGGHDDIANAAAGALTLVTGVGVKAKRPVVFSGSAEEKVNGSGKTTELYATWGRPNQLPHRDYAELGCACTRCARHRYLNEHNAACGASNGALASAHIKREELEDERAWEINKQFENEPVVPGSVVWHVNQS
jgi:hypothetical protein